MGSSSRRLLNQSTQVQCCELDGLEAPPWPTSMDYLSLVETVDCFGESIVVAVADAADRGFDTGFRQTSVYRMDRYWLPLSL